MAAVYQFDPLRRQHLRHQPLAGGEGSVLDPVVAIRYKVTLEPDQVITLDPEETPAFAREHDLEPDNVYRSELMRAEIQTAIDEVNSHYAPVEQIKRFEILPEDFSQPTGELTPTLKVKRSIVQKKYAETIDAIYRSPSDRTTQPPR